MSGSKQVRSACGQTRYRHGRTPGASIYRVPHNLGNRDPGTFCRCLMAPPGVLLLLDVLEHELRQALRVHHPACTAAAVPVRRLPEGQAAVPAQRHLARVGRLARFSSWSEGPSARSGRFLECRRAGASFCRAQPRLLAVGRLRGVEVPDGSLWGSGKRGASKPHRLPSD